MLIFQECQLQHRGKTPAFGKSHRSWLRSVVVFFRWASARMDPIKIPWPHLRPGARMMKTNLMGGGLIEPFFLRFRTMRSWADLKRKHVLSGKLGVSFCSLSFSHQQLRCFESNRHFENKKPLQETMSLPMEKLDHHLVTCRSLFSSMLVSSWRKYMAINMEIHGNALRQVVYCRCDSGVYTYTPVVRIIPVDHTEYVWIVGCGWICHMNSCEMSGRLVLHAAVGLRNSVQCVACLWLR